MSDGVSSLFLLFKFYVTWIERKHFIPSGFSGACIFFKACRRLNQTSTEIIEIAVFCRSVWGDIALILT